MSERIKIIIVAVLGILAIITLSVGCSSKRQLSDEQLAQIFHDAFLANAYTKERGISLDSLRLYEPIFQSYGYTTEDVQYTIGSFSTRKSAKLSDVVERAIAMLEERGLELDREVEILNSIDEIVKRRATEVVYSDSLLEYRSLRDSSKMKIVIDDPRPGSYKIEFDYLIDTLDKTTPNYKSRSWLEEVRSVAKSDSTTIAKFNENNAILKRNEVTHFSRTLPIDKRAERLVVELVLSDEEKKEERRANRNVTVKRVTITRSPDIDEARESIFQELMGVNIFDDELLFKK